MNLNGSTQLKKSSDEFLDCFEYLSFLAIFPTNFKWFIGYVCIIGLILKVLGQNKHDLFYQRFVDRL